MLRITFLTVGVMVAFAANSVLSRLPIEDGGIGAWEFTLVRLAAGTVVLVVLVRRRLGRTFRGAFDVTAALGLLAYAGLFSAAYVTLPTGTGALILFGVVQVTMIAGALVAGERMGGLGWTGLALALSGLAVLVGPQVAPPSPIGALAMAGAGIGWGIYSLRGRRVDAPALQRTAANFALALGMSMVLSVPVFLWQAPRAPAPDALTFAVISGAVTSSLGYALWYRVLPALSTVTASVSQLSVPVIAAVGGLLFLSEPLGLRFALASLLTLGGVALAIRR